jgi:hypothetical protein
MCMMHSFLCKGAQFFVQKRKNQGSGIGFQGSGVGGQGFPINRDLRFTPTPRDRDFRFDPTGVWERGKGPS